MNTDSFVDSNTRTGILKRDVSDRFPNFNSVDLSKKTFVTRCDLSNKNTKNTLKN